MEYLPRALPVGPDEFEETWALWDTVPWTPNPMNKKHNIRRKQATFGDTYKFAGQVSHEVTHWTPLVHKVLEWTRTHAGSEAYNVVHANWYPDGSAGLAAHSDNMAHHVPDLPIYSFTFLSAPGTPRGFQVYDKATGEQVDELMLDHGDLVIMSAAMQQTRTHGIKKSAAKKYAQLRRLNLTVRAWRAS